MSQESGNVAAIASIPVPRGLRLAMGGMVASLVVVSAQIQIPVPPVPFTLQTAATGLAGLLLPPGEAAFSMLVYLGLGTFLPVFAGFRGGLGVLLGPTGGFLLAFPLQAALTSWCFRRRMDLSLGWLVFCLMLGLIPVFGLGAVGLVIFGGLPPGQAVRAVLPFLPGGFLKALLSALVFQALAPRLPRSYRPFVSPG
jgi:biotin transport system substrate-specific component